MKRRNYILVVSILLLSVILSSCGQATEQNSAENLNQVVKNPVVTIEMENGDIIKAELYPEIAPMSVRNFVYLIEKGFYDGLTFHRVISGFMIQGGDPDGTGRGGPGYSIKGEFAANGFENNLDHARGVLSMARKGNPLYDSAGSQFFLMHQDSPFLNGQYAGFGRVIEGIEAVDKIATAQTGPTDNPIADQRMKTVTVETHGVTYAQPEKLQ